MKTPSPATLPANFGPIVQTPRSPLRNGNRQGNWNNAPRCGAKTRSGEPCKVAAMRRSDGKYTRCRMHGGASTGAKSEEGKLRIARAQYKHGRYSKEAKAHQRYVQATGAFDSFVHKYRPALLQCAESLDAAALQSDEPTLAKNCKLILKYLEVEGELIAEVVNAAKSLGIDDAQSPRYSRADPLMQALRAGAKGQGCERFLELMALQKRTPQKGKL